MYMPKVSIIIPVFNGSDYLKQSIDSALSQTYSNIEIIVVNDGSNDDGASEKIALDYKGKIRYFAKENGGVSSALNYGIKQMDGEWFSWLSHDDIYKPNKIAEQIEYLNKVIISQTENSANKSISNIVLYCDTEFINSKGEVILRLKPIAKEFESTKEIILKNIKNNRLGGCSFLINKSAFLDMGGFNERIRTVSDYDYWYRLLLNGYKFYYVPKTLVQGRMHKKQVTYKLSDLGYKELNEFHTWLLKQLERKPEYDYKVFLKIGFYARQRGYVESSRFALKIARHKKNNLLCGIEIAIGRLYCEVYRNIRKVLKSIFVEIYIK